MKKTGKKGTNRPVKRYLDCYYMTDAEIGVREMVDTCQKKLPQLKEQIEFWEAAEVIELTAGEKDSVDIEKIELFEEEADQKFLQSNGIKAIFTIHSEEANLDLVKQVFTAIVETCGGFVCSDTPDFLPYLVRPYTKILHLDAGRKYFAPEYLKQMIAAMRETGYREFQIAFGNDGLRLLQDDMTIDGKSSEEVKAAVKAGNVEFNGDPSCLIQEEMDEIFACAAQVGIEIVPLLNMPGHMDTSLNINPAYRWHSDGKISRNSLDLADEKAVSFALELLEKYASYFASRGSRKFCFGVDEYANDIYNLGGLGFNRLLEENRYGQLVAFINRAAAVIKKAGLIPRAFNDGFYYNEDTSMVLDTDIEVCYWGKGWCGFNCAAVDTIAAKGHPMINCNGAWYYVLKHENEVQKPVNHPEFESFHPTIFPGNQAFENPAGAVFCIWCDNSVLRTSAEVTADMIEQMKLMAPKLELQ
ncbi:MAG: family 20 glycosylhydrolase [Lachnospiraceae bacterium]|nr:family 20 glycosylhydrolase [Lachnospiraceae bacterium]